MTDSFPMTSARYLGGEHGLNAVEMNFLLKEEGFLEGVAGAYRLTEKGERYAQEQDHDRGNGGYPSYNPQWTTRLWDRKITDEIDLSPERKQQIRQAAAEAKKLRAAEREEARAAYEADHAARYGQDRPRIDPLTLAVGAALAAVSVYGITKAAPHLKALWTDKAAPRIQQLKDRRGDVIEDGDPETLPSTDPDAASPSGDDDSPV